MVRCAMLMCHCFRVGELNIPQKRDERNGGFIMESSTCFKVMFLGLGTWTLQTHHPDICNGFWWMKSPKYNDLSPPASWGFFSDFFRVKCKGKHGFWKMAFKFGVCVCVLNSDLTFTHGSIHSDLKIIFAPNPWGWWSHFFLSHWHTKDFQTSWVRHQRSYDA